jgi:hypothetical protein
MLLQIRFFENLHKQILSKKRLFAPGFAFLYFLHPGNTEGKYRLTPLSATNSGIRFSRDTVRAWAVGAMG